MERLERAKTPGCRERPLEMAIHQTPTPASTRDRRRIPFSLRLERTKRPFYTTGRRFQVVRQFKPASGSRHRSRRFGARVLGSRPAADHESATASREYRQ